MRVMRDAWRWALDQFGRALSVVYYEFLFDDESALSGGLAARVHMWEQQRGKGDVPIPKTLWERQYETGHWNFLKALGELGRFSVVVGYLKELTPDAAVLDVGCGEGLLFKRLQPRSLRYLGLDISAAAIAKASETGEGPFICADAEHYALTDTYDVIVFNECLYYFRQPLEAVERYAGSLTHDGIMIVSTYSRSRRGRSILRALKRTYTLLDETLVSHGSESWICSVLTRADVTRSARVRDQRTPAERLRSDD